jgi:hypothetical protein
MNRRGRQLHLAFIATLLLAAAPSAPAEVVDIHWSADGRFSHRGSVAAGKMIEVCGKLPAGTKVRWDFHAEMPVDFNVHYHIGKEVVFPAKLSAATTGSDTLETKVQQDYCWMWSNASTAPVPLTVELSR